MARFSDCEECPSGARVVCCSLCASGIRGKRLQILFENGESPDEFACSVFAFARCEKLELTEPAHHEVIGVDLCGYGDISSGSLLYENCAMRYGELVQKIAQIYSRVASDPAIGGTFEASQAKRRFSLMTRSPLLT